ncbi:MAG: peptidoglycan-associated lipoprotein [Desulfobacteraceae bacterium IS3]|nr:MAG: peptidoglycan-associated lipoprotein [Desulfobacteraceae bacterium IS3]
MEKKRWAVIIICFAISGLMLTTASCSKKKAVCENLDIQKDQLPRQAAGGSGTSDADTRARTQAIENARSAAPEDYSRRGGEGDGYRTSGYGNVMDEDVYFAFDSAVLSGEAKENLRRKAEWLQSNAGRSVTIEGHCDERGTNEYNIALGDRRAESAKSFLTTLGIAASRMNTVSYGEERPVDQGHGESSWAKNRRAHFVVH